MRFAHQRFWPPIVALAACSAPLGAEHHGSVKFGGLPIPERPVPVAAGAPAPQWELKLLPFEDIQSSAVPAEPPQSPPAAAAKPVAAAASQKTKRAPDVQPAKTFSAFQRADLNASLWCKKYGAYGRETPCWRTQNGDPRL